MIVDGNSNLKLYELCNWMHYFGVENVYMYGVDGDFEHISEFYIDIRNCQHNRDDRVWIARPDELYLVKGFMRIWYD